MARTRWPGGDVLVVKELVNLRSDYIPWTLERRPGYDSIARVMRLRDVTIKIDGYGTAYWEPFEYETAIVAEHLLARRDGVLQALETDALVAAADAAADAQVVMYEQASHWDPVYRVGYGADMYASIADPMARFVGLDLRDEINAKFHATAARVAGPLASGEEPLLIIERLGEASGDVLLSSALPASTAARSRMTTTPGPSAGSAPTSSSTCSGSSSSSICAPSGATRCGRCCSTSAAARRSAGSASTSTRPASCARSRRWPRPRSSAGACAASVAARTRSSRSS